MDIFEMRATERRLTNQVAALRNMLREVDESLADIEQTIHGDNADKIANLRGWIEAVLAATQPDNNPFLGHREPTPSTVTFSHLKP